MGGKKKKTQRAPLKKESKYKIPSRFDCPVCDSKTSISVKVSRQTGTARIFCTRCRIGSDTTMTIKPLEKNVDIFFKFREALLALDNGDLSSRSLPYENSNPSEGISSSRIGRATLGASSSSTPEIGDAVDFFGPSLEEEDEEDPFR